MSRADRYWIGIAAVCIAGISIRLLHIGDAHDADEGAFLVIAQGMLRGMVPYRDLIDHKPPGLELLAAPFLALGGDRLARIAYLVLSASAVVPVARIADSIGGRPAGLFAALFYVAQPLFIRQSGALSQSVIAATFEVWAAWLVLEPWNGPRWRPVVGGVLAGMAFWVKQPGALVIGGFAAMLLPELWNTRSRPQAAEVALQVLLGIAAACLLPVAALAALGVLPQFGLYVFLVNEGLGVSASAVLGVLSLGFLTLGGPMLAMAPVGLRDWQARPARLLAGWAAGHLLMFFLYPIFYQHYGYFLFAQTAIAAGAATAILSPSSRTLAAAALCVGALCWVTGMALEPDYSEGEDSQEDGVSEYVAERVPRDSPIMVLWNPIVYYESDRPVFSKYFYWGWRYLQSPVAAEYLDSYHSALRNRRPSAVILSDAYRQDLVDRAPSVLDDLRDNYLPARVIPGNGPRHTSVTIFVPR